MITMFQFYLHEMLGSPLGVGAPLKVQFHVLCKDGVPGHIASTCVASYVSSPCAMELVTIAGSCAAWPEHQQYWKVKEWKETI